jgi:hypothetical protein
MNRREIAQILVRTRDFPTERSEGVSGNATVAAQRPTHAEYLLYLRGRKIPCADKDQARARAHPCESGLARRPPGGGGEGLRGMRGCGRARGFMRPRRSGLRRAQTERGSGARSWVGAVRGHGLPPSSVRTEPVEVRCRVATAFDKLRPNGDPGKPVGWGLAPHPLRAKLRSH